MCGLDERTGRLFSYVDLEKRVPAQHPLRAIRGIVNESLRDIGTEFEAVYSSIGRPSIAPEELLRALLLQLFHGIRSERQMMERLDFDLSVAGSRPLRARCLAARLQSREAALETGREDTPEIAGQRLWWHGLRDGSAVHGINQQRARLIGPENAASRAQSLICRFFKPNNNLRFDCEHED